VIDSQAIIHPSAKIAATAKIGPWTIIEANVEIGEHTIIESHAVIRQNTRIGKHNHIFQFASLGEKPQHLNYKGEDTRLEIGDYNIIREFCTLNRGTVPGGSITRIGNHNFLMSYVHIAHDCHVGNYTIFVNNASIAGHVRVEDYVSIGGFVGVHQFCTVGAYSFLTQAALIGKDVLPYLMVSGNNAKVAGLNTVGLKRRGFSDVTIKKLKSAYNIIFRRGNTVNQALIELNSLVEDCPEVRLFIEALRNSARGIVR